MLRQWLQKYPSLTNLFSCYQIKTLFSLWRRSLNGVILLSMRSRKLYSERELQLNVCHVCKLGSWMDAWRNRIKLQSFSSSMLPQNHHGKGCHNTHVWKPHWWQELQQVFTEINSSQNQQHCCPSRGIFYRQKENRVRRKFVQLKTDITTRNLYILTEIVMGTTTTIWVDFYKNGVGKLSVSIKRVRARTACRATFVCNCSQTHSGMSRNVPERSGCWSWWTGTGEVTCNKQHATFSLHDNSM